MIFLIIKRLDNVRDLFITGLWTGLRISDLKRINSFDMSHNRIKISETEKTDTFVEIPIHSQLRQILENERVFYLKLVIKGLMSM